MSKKIKMAALDCGNSSYRLVLGTYENDELKMETIAQEKNAMINIDGFYYWDVLKMYQFLIDNLKKLVMRGDIPDSIAVSTWGVDFGLYDEEGFRIGDVLSYRNTFGEDVINKIERGDLEDLFMRTGILSDRINSIYLLSALQELMPSKIEACRHVLMIPDIFNYLLTGIMMNEPSELSTTQLFNSKTKSVDESVCEFFGIPAEWFSEIGEHGKMIGKILPAVKDQIGSDKDIPVICVPSHDTAAAVSAIPADKEEFLFISSGTWALIGAELEQPIINEKVLKAGLTNEVGAFNKITLLKNSTGMFVLEKMKTEYEEEVGKEISWDEFLNIKPIRIDEEIININSADFFNPSSMSKAIMNSINSNNVGKVDWGNLIDVVERSMAENYASTLSDVEEVIGKKFDSVYIVGGGSKNSRINRLTAEYTRKDIITCGDESTSLGNLGIQLNYFFPEFTLKSIRGILKNSIDMIIYKPDM